MKNIVARYYYDDSGKVEFMLGACYSSEKDARIAAQMKGGVVMTAEDDRGNVIEAAAKAGLFNYDYDQYGCAVHLIGYDAQVSLEDWADDAVEIEI